MAIVITMEYQEMRSKTPSQKNFRSLGRFWASDFCKLKME